MEDSPCRTDKMQISYESLSYLIEHPESQDTIEGIAQWWLLERKIKRQIANVKEALEELITRGFVLEHRGTHYQINKNKYEEIQSILKQCS